EFASIHPFASCNKKSATHYLTLRLGAASRGTAKGSHPSTRACPPRSLRVAGPNGPRACVLRIPNSPPYRPSLQYVHLHHGASYAECTCTTTVACMTPVSRRHAPRIASESGARRARVSKRGYTVSYASLHGRTAGGSQNTPYTVYLAVQRGRIRTHTVRASRVRVPSTHTYHPPTRAPSLIRVAASQSQSRRIVESPVDQLVAPERKANYL
ncbi:hypothetical protein C8J57DRAFT_1618985, partial [Mycena rebaudengoi]